MSAPSLERIQDENEISLLFGVEATSDPLLAQCMRDRATRLAAAVIQRRASDLMALCLGRTTDILDTPFNLALDLLLWCREAGIAIEASPTTAREVITVFEAKAALVR